VIADIINYHKESNCFGFMIGSSWIWTLRYLVVVLFLYFMDKSKH